MNPLKIIKPLLVKYEPEILMAIGISGMTFSTIWGVKSTVKATKMVEDEEKRTKNKLSAKDVIKLTWKLYIPVVAMTAVSIPCIITGNRVASKRYAALATACTLSEEALQEYQNKAKEIVGEKKDQAIRDAVAKDQIGNNQPSQNNIFITGDGDSLFYEPLSGRYFKSSWNKLSKAANELNRTATSSMEGYVQLNTWYEAIGLSDTELGDIMGWDLRRGVKSLIDIEMSSNVTKDNVPCGSIEYINKPTHLDY